MADADAKSGIQASRTKLNELKNIKNKLIDEKKIMRIQLDTYKDKTDKLLKEKKDTKNNVKFNSVDEINNEIKKLEKKQETTSMTLNDEKRLIKEIDALKASKKFVVDLKTTDASIDNVKEEKKSIINNITLKDKEIDEISKQIKDVMDIIDTLNKTDTKKRDIMNELFKERDDLRKQMNLKIIDKDKLRDDNRKLNDAFYLFQRAVRKQKQIQYEEEKRKREEDKAVYLAKIEEEEAKKIPYEEEQGLCEFLANYLERTYLNKTDEKSDVNGTVNKNDVVIEVKDDPFAGLMAKNKKDIEEEAFYVGKASKKKRVRPMKKQDVTTGPFTLSVDTFEQFGLIQLTPPTSIDQVEKSVKELREKKEWYKNQPRGSVPTASEVRKAAKKLESMSLNNNNNKTSADNGNNKKGGKFALSSDDFAPLGAGGIGGASSSATFNTTWGKGSSLPTVSDATPTPAEAAAADEDEN